MRKWMLWLMLATLCLGLVAAPAAATEPGNFLVVLTADTIDEQTLTAVQDAGGEVTARLDQIGVIAVQAGNARAFLDAVAQVPGVMTVAPDLTWQVADGWDANEATAETNAVDDPAAYTWGVQRVTNDGAAWSIHEGTHDVVVAVVDSGIDLTHPDLVANLMPGSQSFVPDGLGPQDRYGHGTHLAGTIAANGRIKGVAPGVGIRAYRVLGANGRGANSWIMAGIVAAADDGVDVINLSLGGKLIKGQYYYIDPVTGERTRMGNDTAEWVAYRRAIDYAVKRNVTVVVAAGNDGMDLANKNAVTAFWNRQLAPQGFAVQGASFVTPASLPGVITVSAMGGGWGTADRLASYSNYGNGAISMTAPGGDSGPAGTPSAEAFKYRVLSTVPPAVMCPALEKSLFGQCGYRFATGTSMAAPHVAATAALVISEEYARTGSKPAPAQVITRLMQTADDVGKVGHDGAFGAGLVNAYRALGGQ